MKHLFFTILYLIPVMIFSQTPGTLDVSFGNNGSVITDFGNNYNYCRTSDIQSDQKLILAGNTLSPSVSNMSFLRYLPDGNLDTGFGNGGFITHVFGASDEYINDVIAMDDGDPDASFGVNGDGIVITDVSPAGTTNPDDRISDVHIDADGRIVVTGEAKTNQGNTDFAAAKYYSGLNISTPEVPDIDENEIILNPLPFNSTLCARFKNKLHKGAVFSISDLTGKILIRKELRSISRDQQVIINTRFLSQGLYVFRYFTGDKIISRKILKIDNNH